MTTLAGSQDPLRGRGGGRSWVRIAHRDLLRCTSRAGRRRLYRPLRHIRLHSAWRRPWVSNRSRRRATTLLLAVDRRNRVLRWISAKPGRPVVRRDVMACRRLRELPFTGFYWVACADTQATGPCRPPRRGCRIIPAVQVACLTAVSVSVVLAGRPGGGGVRPGRPCRPERRHYQSAPGLNSIGLSTAAPESLQ
jgi:hypothetical protein